MKRLNIKSTIKIIISCFLLVLLYKLIDKEAFIKNFKSMNLSFLPLIFMLIILNYFVSSARWKKLLSIYEKGETISFLVLVKLYFIGSFFNNFLPTSVGGDVYKAMRLSKFLENKSNAFASTFMERFSGVLILGLLSLVGLIYTFGQKGLVIAFISFGILFSGFFFLKKFGRKIPKLEAFVTALFKYKNHKDIVVYALITSVLVQLLSILTQHVIFISLGSTISFGFSLFAFPVIILASFFIPSQNSLGVQDALYAAFFLNAGISVETSLSASIIYHFARLIVSLIGGFFYAFGR